MKSVIGSVVKFELDQEEKKEEKKIEKKAPVKREKKIEKTAAIAPVEDNEEFTAVSMRMSIKERDAFKMYCLAHHLKLSDAFSAAAREFMENHP